MSSDYEPSSSNSYGGDCQGSSRRTGECAAAMSCPVPASVAVVLAYMGWVQPVGPTCWAPPEQWCRGLSAAT